MNLERVIGRVTNNRSGTPPGAMLIWVTDTAPTGWLLCYGQAISRTDYANIFSVLGTTYGTGDGSTTFNLPDLRGRVPLGKDNMGGTHANRVTASQAGTLGQSSGEESHTLSTGEMPSHTHNINDTHGQAADDTRVAAATGNQGSNNNNAIDPTGGGGSHNNMQPYLTMSYIIKI